MHEPATHAERGTPIPKVSVSRTTTRENVTGSWKYIRPVYRDRVAPCNQGCPVGIDIGGYMSLLREGRTSDAIELLLRENPMPAVTGRVCDHPCESACNRRHFDDAVSIHAVERMLGDLADPTLQPPPSRAARGEHVAIVGAGPAGLACAYHLARLGYDVTVFDDAEEPGGMLRQGIPEYRLPRDVLDREIQRIEAQGVRILSGMRLGNVLDDVTLREYDAVFLATGAHRNRALGVEGEEAADVRSGLDFLKAVNRGERPELGRSVAVIGGGNTAMDCARTALRLGARPVVVYRRTRQEMPAIDEEVREAEREGVEFVFLAAPARFHEADGRLRGVECTRMALGEPDESGRRRPVPVDHGHFSVPVDTVLTAVGERAELDVLPGELESRRGDVAVDLLGATNVPLFFAGGDLAGADRTVAHALGSGKRGAIGIDRFLRAQRGENGADAAVDALRWGVEGNLSMSRWRGDDPVRRVDPVNEAVELAELNLEHFARVPTHPDRNGAGAASGFEEVNAGLSRDDALAEAARCFNCGVCNECELCLIFCPDAAILRNGRGAPFLIDLDYCKGCGVCAHECPRGAITMTREGL